MSTSYTLRFAKAEDMEAVHRLVRALALFERAPDEVITNAFTLMRDGFGDNACFQCIVAERPGGEIAGAAIFYMAHSTWKGRIMYLDDLIVDERYRGQGMGKALLNEVILQSCLQGANQLRWHVLDWNEPAIRLYQQYGADLDPEWITCKLSRAQMEKLAGL